MKVTQIQGHKGLADIGGMQRQVDLRLLEGIQVGDYVLVHAGFALQRLDHDQAEETLALLREMLSGDEISG
jgi:hydrogenase expression/formation protein HypC